MPASLLILWPRDQGIETAGQVAGAQQCAPERTSLQVLIAGGDQTATVADARLDNAGELRSALALPATAADEEILDAAWERWGERFPERLAGDFAWARWDPGSHELLLVRDHLGMRPLAYARYRDGFAASTDMRALRSLPGVDLRDDERYLVMLFTDITLDRTSTPYRGIRRVEPGSLARVRDAGEAMRVRSYWRLPDDDLRLPAEEDYLERFRTLFLEAVACRVPDGDAMASELSGGLDSTVVTAALADLLADRRVLALAASFAEGSYDDGIHDEGEHRRWAREDPRIDLVEVPASEVMTADSIDRLMIAHGGPVAPFMDLVRLRLWREARRRGAPVVFDGFDGDTTVNYGFERLAGLARRGHFVTLGRETVAAYRKAGRLGLRETATLLTNSSIHAAVRRVRQPGAVRRCLASRDLLERSGFLEGLRALPVAPVGDVRRDHTLDVTSGTMSLAIERLDVAATAAGVDVRHPFFDRRLVEFCVSLPSDLLYRERMPRWIERQALEGIGPDSVRWRHDKAAMPYALAHEALECLGAESAPPEGIDDVIDRQATAEALRRWRLDRNPTDAGLLYPLYELSRWRTIDPHRPV